MDISTSFGLWLKQRRKAMDLTQADLARCANCSVVTIQKIEAEERRPSRQMAELLAQCLDIPPQERPTFLKVARAELRVERLAEIARTPAAPLDPWRTPAPLTSNLPVSLTPLVGREPDLAAIIRLLDNPQCQLLTLVGPGGIGKTRLAIEVASLQRQAFGDQVYFVSLASVSSSEFIVPTIAQAIGFAFYGSEPLQEQLLNYLQPKQMLLLLDNFEHLLTPALAASAAEDVGPEQEGGEVLIVVLLERAPGVKLLVTSRERLNLQGEWLVEIEGLPFPEETEAEEGDMARFPAVALFVDSAQRVNPGFALTGQNQADVGRICRLLAGIPLGINLAAAWVRLLSCREIAQEIERNLDFLSTTARDAPDRQRSLRAAFDYSWKLLSAEERQVMRRLSVFRSGFQREAAEQATSATLPLLSALVDKSLLRRTSAGRYDMHELMRQYVAAKLQDDPEELVATYDHCSRYYAALLKQWEEPLKSDEQPEILEKMSLEIDNLRLAWGWMVTQQQISNIQKSLHALWLFYEVRGWLHEGATLFEQAVQAFRASDQGGLAQATDRRRSLVLGQVLAHQGWFCIRLGWHDQAHELLQQSLALLRLTGDQAALATSLDYMGIEHCQTGDYAEARPMIQESIALNRALGNQWGLAFCLNSFGNLCLEQGDYQEAYLALNESLSLLRTLGDLRETAFCLWTLGAVADRLGQPAKAQQLLAESLEISQTLNYRWGVANSLRNLGAIVLKLGDMGRAESLFRQSVTLFREVGERFNLTMALNYLGNLTGAQGEYQQARRAFREALAMAIEIQATSIMLESLAGLAGVWAKEEAAEAALELVLHLLNHPALTRETRTQAEQLQSELEAQLSPQQIEATQRQAQAKPFEVVMQELLDNDLSAGALRAGQQPNSSIPQDSTGASS